MAKLNYIIFSDKVSFEESELEPGNRGKLNIMGTFDSIYARGFPAIHPFMSVVINVDIEAGNHIEVFKVKKNGREIVKIETPFSKAESGGHNFIHNLIKVRFPEEGEYTAELFIDGQFLGFEKFHLKKV